MRLPEHRVFIEDKAGNVLSPFHDIPLWANEQKVSNDELPLEACKASAMDN